MKSWAERARRDPLVPTEGNNCNTSLDLLSPQLQTEPSVPLAFLDKDRVRIQGQLPPGPQSPSLQSYFLPGSTQPHRVIPALVQD